MKLQIEVRASLPTEKDLSIDLWFNTNVQRPIRTSLLTKKRRVPNLLLQKIKYLADIRLIYVKY